MELQWIKHWLLYILKDIKERILQMWKTCSTLFPWFELQACTDNVQYQHPLTGMACSTHEISKIFQKIMLEGFSSSIYYTWIVTPMNFPREGAEFCYLVLIVNVMLKINSIWSMTDYMPDIHIYDMFICVLQFLCRLWAPQPGHAVQILLQTQQEAQGNRLTSLHEFTLSQADRVTSGSTVFRQRPLKSSIFMCFCCWLLIMAVVSFCC